MSDDPQPIEASRPPPVRPPALPMRGLLIVALAFVAFLTGLGRTMASAPSSANDFLIEKVALAAALLLFLLGLAAFAVPGIRRAGTLFGIATVVVLILLSSLVE